VLADDDDGSVVTGGRLGVYPPGLADEEIGTACMVVVRTSSQILNKLSTLSHPRKSITHTHTQVVKSPSLKYKLIGNLNLTSVD
jgi:hypothetical protein